MQASHHARTAAQKVYDQMRENDANADHCRDMTAFIFEVVAKQIRNGRLALKENHERIGPDDGLEA